MSVTTRSPSPAKYAKAYAIKKDWTVAEENVYVADGSDGSERARPDSLFRP